MAKILIVEDSPTQQESIKRVVEAMGHETLCVNDGAEALEAAISFSPHLILMDIIMPNTNGFQATRILTRDERTKHIPVVLVTTKSEQTDQVWGMRQGARAYVVKPFDASELQKVLIELLEETQA